MLQILLISPLFEEANRCRRLIACIMRGLDAFGIGAALPDLPGTGESLSDISDVRIPHWQDALQSAHAALSAEGKSVISASFRGGALLDGIEGTIGTWRFAPESGHRIVRDLRRTQLTNGSDKALYAGHALSAEFLEELAELSCQPIAPVRTVRLDNDSGDADLHVTGSPFWRRAEPGDDPELAAALTSDLILWAKTCAG